MAVNKVAPVRIRGARVTAPPGYIVGRTGSESGEVQLISIADLGATLQKIGAVPKAEKQHVRLSVFLQGPFSAGQRFTMTPAPVTTDFPSALPSVAQCDVAPTNPVVFYLLSNLSAFLTSGPPNGVVATITFAAGSTTGTITYNGAQVVPQNATLILHMPGLP